MFVQSLVGALVASMLGADPGHGFDRDGIGIEMGGYVGVHIAWGVSDLATQLAGPEPSGAEFSGTVRLRLGRHLGIGVSYESVSVLMGMGGDEDYVYSRQQVAVDVQWRFLDQQLVRPWVGAGMAWGTLARDHNFCQGCDVTGSSLWEFLRLEAGVDLVLAAPVALGPAVRFGVAHWEAPEGGRSVKTISAGLRVTLAFP